MSKIAIEAIKKQIQVIAFDANLFDLGIITDNPHQKNCSDKRKQLNAELVRLGGIPKPLPFQEPDKRPVPQEYEQMELL